MMPWIDLSPVTAGDCDRTVLIGKAAQEQKTMLVAAQRPPAGRPAAGEPGPGERAPDEDRPGQAAPEQAPAPRRRQAPPAGT